MATERFKFFLTWTKDDPELNIEHEADILYVGDTYTGRVIWCDNKNNEWLESMFKISSIMNDPDFREVTIDKCTNSMSCGIDAVEILLNYEKLSNISNL